MAEAADWLKETTKGMELELMAERLVIERGESMVFAEGWAYAEAELRTLREDRDKLRGFFEHLALTVWEFCDIDGGEFQDHAVEQGLLVSVPADEQFRAEYDCDTMFTWSWSQLAPDAAKGE